MDKKQAIIYILKNIDTVPKNIKIKILKMLHDKQIRTHEHLDGSRVCLDKVKHKDLLSIINLLKSGKNIPLKYRIN